MLYPAFFGQGYIEAERRDTGTAGIVKTYD